MSKLRFNIALLALVGLTYTAYAQPFSFQANPKTSSTTQNSSTPALSADDFKAQVNSKSQQAQQDVFQQTQTTLNRQASQMPLPNSPPKPPKLNNQLQNSTTTTSSTPNTTTQASAATPQPQESVATAPTVATPAPVISAAPMNPTNSSAAASINTPTPAVEPTQNQVYTGFGGGTTTNNNKSSAPSSQSSGGWSVKY